MGSLTLTPAFTPNRTEYYVTWTEGVDENFQTVTFETSDPDAQTTAVYMYLGTAPVRYVWEEPPYVFDGWDNPAVIIITVEKDGREKKYKVYVRGNS